MSPICCTTRPRVGPCASRSRGSELGGVAGSRLSAAPLVVDVWLERIADGIVVHGTVSGRVRERVQPVPGAGPRASSRRRSASSSSATSIEGETYPLEGEEIDLELPVRDTVLLDLPADAAVPRGLRRAVPDVRHRPQRGRRATATPTRPIHGGTRLRALTFDD